MAELAPLLRETLLPDALAAAREIGDERARASALAKLALHLPETLLPDALAAARAIRDERARPSALAQLAPLLPEPQREAALREALAAARAIREACITILFLASTTIIFGAAKGVARAVEEGLEQKVLKLFGVAEHRTAKARAKTRKVAIEKATVSREAKRSLIVEESPARSHEAYKAVQTDEAERARPSAARRSSVATATEQPG